MAKLDEPQRAEIQRSLEQGLSSEQIARRLGVPKMRVAAVKAHMTMGTYGSPSAPQSDLVPEDLDEAADAADLKFGLERDMQEAIRRNIDQLDPRLRIVDGGKERHVESGFIDILAEDEDGNLVVIELKSGDAPDTAITQLLSYMGALKANDPDRGVRGILVAREFTQRVRLAAAAAGIRLMTYGFNFTFADAR